MRSRRYYSNYEGKLAKISAATGLQHAIRALVGREWALAPLSSSQGIFIVGVLP